MSNIITVTGLKQAAEKYDPILRTLPAWQLRQAITELKLNMKKVDLKDVRTMKRRHAGGTKPYVTTAESISYSDNLLEFETSELAVDPTVFCTKENIMSYEGTKDYTFIGGKPVDNVAKKHPLEYQILEAMILNHSEDIMFALFHAGRDNSGSTPQTAFNGFYTQVDALITAGKLTAARGNYAPTGAFTRPTSTSDTAAYENLVDWILGSHPMLRSSIGGDPILYITEDTLLAVREALRNKLQYLSYPSMDQLTTYLREDARTPGLQIISHIALGQGSRLMLAKPGLLDFGWNTEAAAKFVQVRNPFEDPNVVQFWLQAAYGTRINDWHEKVFRTNDQTNEVVNLAGDYSATGAITVAISGAAGQWYIDSDSRRRSSGQYLLGVTPGAHTIHFTDVDGFTTPSDISITVAAGADISKTATYTASGNGGQGGSPENNEPGD